MTPDPPNIVLVSMDSLRADHCGYLGDDRNLTPTLDALASDGVAFETAIAPGPRTFSTMPAMFTGHHGTSTSLSSYPGETEWEQRLAAIDGHLRRHTTIPEYLQSLGYDTAGFSPNPWTSSASGFDRGFDEFVDFSGNGEDGWLHRLVDGFPTLETGRRPMKMVLNMATGQSFFTRWESFYDQILAVREQLEEPYFLWVFLLDTHYPFITARAHREEQSLAGMYYSAYRSEGAMRGTTDSMSPAVHESLQRSYRDTVRASDRFLEQLQADLAGDDPALVVHSDHGEAFGEHGSYGHHTGDVYEENIHVPYVVHNAGATASIAGPTSLTTIADAVETLARGESLDPSALVSPSVFAADVRGTNRTVRGERYKLVESDGETALYDLQADPDERTDVSRTEAAVCRAYEERLDEYVSHLTEVEDLGRIATAVAATTGL